MRVANFNIRATPPMLSRRVRADLRTARDTGASVFTWQELGKYRRYRKQLRLVLQEHAGWRHFFGPARRSGISVDTDLHEIVRVRAHRLSKRDLRAGQPRREAIEVVVVGRVFDQYATCVISAHLTNGGYNGRRRTPWIRRRRQQLWDQQWAELRELVAHRHAQGYDVVVNADFNRDDLPRLHVRAEIVLGHGIMKTIVVPAEDQHLEARARGIIPERSLNTDHEGLVATLRRVVT